MDARPGLVRYVKEFGFVAIAALVALFLLVLYPKWREAVDRGGQDDAEPFRIADNFYYVGAADTTAFLLTGPEGHVLIDGGFPGTPPMIVASITRLGFDIKDVRVLLNTEAYPDHAGGLAELQKASGAQLWINQRDADSIAAGGAGGRSGPLDVFTHPPFFQFPAPRVDRRFGDGETIHLGPIALTAHVTPECTVWSFPVHHAGRELHVVHLCGLTPPTWDDVPAFAAGPVRAMNRMAYGKVRPDFERTFRTLRNLPVDIWVTTHARTWGRYRKFQESRRAADPVAPFTDRPGYFRILDEAEAQFRTVF
jgi:metallo-beta-lactamase class B